jgi:D-3-phosphoglycerate dehydrogenase
MCKKGARIINCARGGIIDEKAMLNALNSGHIAGCGLDVLDVEPPNDEVIIIIKKILLNLNVFFFFHFKF